ncbi:MAG TPA: hypothetical protein VMH80_02875 [Bryobacteraceae bacterium]|nr:hypothetical protein [Bryobacteraceae bacterium]
MALAGVPLTGAAFEVAALVAGALLEAGAVVVVAPGIDLLEAACRNGSYGAGEESVAGELLGGAVDVAGAGFEPDDSGVMEIFTLLGSIPNCLNVVEMASDSAVSKLARLDGLLEELFEPAVAGFVSVNDKLWK